MLRVSMYEEDLGVSGDTRGGKLAGGRVCSAVVTIWQRNCATQYYRPFIEYRSPPGNR